MVRSKYKKVSSRRHSTGIAQSSSNSISSELTPDTISTSSLSATLSSTLHLHLNFKANKHPSQIEKCRSFWRYLATRPDLEVLRQCGEAVKEKKESAVLPPRTSPHPWLHQLMKLQARDLPCIALASLPPRSNATEPGTFAYVMENTPTEVMTEIEEFQIALKAREARRDPNQNVLGYKLEQQPPQRVHN